MSRPSPTVSQLLFLLVALVSTVSVAGCAHDPDANKPWKKSQPKWYDSEMSSDERSFFFGSFFNNGGR